MIFVDDFQSQLRIELAFRRNHRTPTNRWVSTQYNDHFRNMFRIYRLWEREHLSKDEKMIDRQLREVSSNIYGDKNVQLFYLCFTCKWNSFRQDMNFPWIRQEKNLFLVKFYRKYSCLIMILRKRFDSKRTVCDDWKKRREKIEGQGYDDDDANLQPFVWHLDK